MKKEFLQYLCRYYALSAGATVRLYQKCNKLCTYSPFSLEPDPFSLYEKEMLNDIHPASILATELFQLYGFVHFKEEYCIVIGPSCILADDETGLQNLMFLLGISRDDSPEYRRKLYCMPNISMERLASCLVFFWAAVNQKLYPPEDVYIRNNTDFYRNPVPKLNANKTLLDADDADTRQTIEKSYSIEKMLLFYIRTGQPECLRELLYSNSNVVKAGKMAKDTLRQLKNMGICAATISSRAAIEGGLDSQTTFRLSDLYIQQFEMMSDAVSIYNLTNKMMLDYAVRIQQIQYPYNTHSKLFQNCVRYISRNLFTPIRVNDMAESLGVARPYLCSHFKEVTGVTLSHYILTEKINEAKRLLLFTDKSLSDISMHLAFSSQSHFQTVFKKIAGKTPLEFRLSDS